MYRKRVHVRLEPTPGQILRGELANHDLLRLGGQWACSHSWTRSIPMMTLGRRSFPLRPQMRRLAPLALIVAVSASAAPQVQAQAEDPAAQQINAFDDTLLSVMKQASKLGPRGRFEKLQPALEKAFNLPVMTRFAVGSTWTTLKADQQAELVRAFSRMTVATYAHNFDGYSGEKFTFDKVDTRGVDKLVHTHLGGTGAPSELTYRMRQSDGAWRVIDVYYNGAVSSLLGQRSEYAATLNAGGAQALARKLNSRAEELLR